MPRLARLADRYCLIRSMTHGNAGHDGGMHVCMTGHSAPAENTPYYGSVVARLCPPAANVPPYVWLQNLAGDVQPRYLTGGFLGAAYSPLRVGTDLDNPSAPGFRVKAFDHIRRSADPAASRSPQVARERRVSGSIAIGTIVGEPGAISRTCRRLAYRTPDPSGVRSGKRTNAGARPLRPPSARAEPAHGPPADRGGDAAGERHGMDRKSPR